MAFRLPAILLFDRFESMTMSLPTLNCVGVLGFFIAFKWKLRRQVWFWCIMTVIAALHVPLFLFIPWTDNWVPAVAIGAIDSADFCLILWILDAVGELMEGPKTDEK